MPRKRNTKKQSHRKRESKDESHRKRGSVRSFWSGTISFGLVTVPVSLFPAVRRGGVSFRLLDEDGTPVERRYYCPKHKKDVRREHIVRGYAIEGDTYVVVSEEDLEEIEPKKSREIDLRQFVDLSEISPFFFNRAYYLTPEGDSNKAYRLLARVMEESGMAGIATFVMRDREYLIAILSEEGILCAETLRFQDELRSPEFVGLPEREDATDDERKKIRKLVGALSADALDPAWLGDTYAEAVRGLAEKRHRKGVGVVDVNGRRPPGGETEEDEEPSGADLLETIRRSLESGGVRSNGRKQASDNLRRRSRDELYERARRLDIPGRSRMNKGQLIREIRRADAES